MSKKIWVYTLNNYTEQDVTFLKGLECKHHVFGYEVGDEGTPHLQGYINFNRTYRLTGLKKLNTRIHWEPAKADEAAINYCKKSGNFFEIDNRKQGKRSDLSAALDVLKESGLKRMRDEYPEVYVKYPRGINDMAVHYMQRDKPVPIVEWIWGPTGSGKTRRVVEAEEDLWISPGELKWFDGYTNQKAALFDDFRANHCSFNYLLRLLDRYPLKVPIKGGFVDFVPERIYVTSCKPPDKIYNPDNFDNEEKVEQLLRRIHKVTTLESE